MRKLIEKFISVTLTIAFALSVLSANAIAESTVHNVSAVGTTRIEGENYTASTHPSVTTKAMSGDRNGVAIWYQQETTSTKYTVSYDIDVEMAGYYQQYLFFYKREKEKKTNI